MTINKLHELSNKKENELYGDIYTECVKKGCDINFIKAFAFRVWNYPIQQTKCFIDKKARGRLEQFSEKKADKLTQWKIYLSVLTKLRPNENKIAEWKESIDIIEYYFKTGNFKNADLFGFWLIAGSDQDYIDILIEQNGENSKIVCFLDSVYYLIEENNNGREKNVEKIREVLIKNGFSKQIEECDKEFIARYKP